MADKSWKAFERRIADVFREHMPLVKGIKRRGPDTSDGLKGKTDIIVPGWAVEVKLWTRIGYMDIFNACIQAEEDKEKPDDIPVAIVKKKGARDKDAIVAMRLESFREYILGGCYEGGN